MLQSAGDLASRSTLSTTRTVASPSAASSACSSIRRHHSSEPEVCLALLGRPDCAISMSTDQEDLDTVTRTCAKCGEERLKKHFSKTQWVSTHSRCRTCVKVPPGQGARAAENLQKQLLEQQEQTARLVELLAQANARLRSGVMAGVDYTETSPEAFMCPISQARMVRATRSIPTCR